MVAKSSEHEKSPTDDVERERVAEVHDRQADGGGGEASKRSPFKRQHGGALRAV